MPFDAVSLESYYSQLYFAAALFDVNRQLVMCSPRFETVFLINTENKQDLCLAIALSKNAELMQRIESVFESRNRLILPEIRVVTALGDRDCSADVFPVYDEKQEFWGVALHLHEARERSIFVAQKERSEALAGLSAIASGLAHEIRNPLSGVKGAAQLLLSTDAAAAEPLAYAERVAKYLKIIISETDRMDRLVKDLLHLTRPRELRSGPVNINRVLHETLVLMQAAARTLQWVESYDPSLPDIHADEDALRQIFMNLAQNAVDAVGQKGQIRLSSQIVADMAIRTGEKRRQIIRVTVEDSGPGIPEELAEKIFTPFYSTKLKGTGLGLAIVNQLVEQHGGSIIVKSVPGEGTVFSVFLPV
jgi:two-component system nitrogen regulation sensor histidine kinase GlnL